MASPRGSIPKPKHKLHRKPASTGGKSPIKIGLFLLILVALLFIGLRFLPDGYKVSEEDSTSSLAKDRAEDDLSTPTPDSTRTRLAQLRWVDGEVRATGREPEIEKSEWLWDGEGLAVKENSASTLRLENQVTIDLAPTTEIRFAKNNKDLVLVRGALSIDTRKQAGESDFFVVTDRGRRQFRIKNKSLILIFQSPQFRSDPASHLMDHLSVHIWQGGLSSEGLSDLKAGESTLLVREFQEDKRDSLKAQLLLSWQKAKEAHAGQFTFSRLADSNPLKFTYDQRTVLAPKNRILCHDLAGQVAAISQGTGLDADLWALMEDEFVVADGHQLLGGSQDPNHPVCRFVAPDGATLISGSLPAVLKGIPKMRRKRVDWVLLERYLPKPDQKLEVDFIKVDLTEMALSNIMEQWVQLPSEMTEKSIVIHKEARSDKEIFLRVVAEFTNCRLSRTDWGYKLVPKKS